MRPFSLLAASLVLFGSAVGGCAYLLPGFDNPLSPDIRDLRIAHVANGVKCAMHAFLIDRQLNLLEIIDEQKKEGRRRCEDPTINSANVSTPTCKNECPAGQWYAVSQCYYKIGIKDPKPADCQPIATWRDINGKDRTTNATLFKKDYLRHCTAIPVQPRKDVHDDYNENKEAWTDFQSSRRFALDPNQKSTIKITMNSANSAKVDYSKIDAKSLNIGSIGNILAVGTTAGAQVAFPSLTATGKYTNNAAITFVMAQQLDEDHIIEKQRSALRKEFALAKRAEIAKSGNGPGVPGVPVAFVSDPPPPRSKAEPLYEQFESDCMKNGSYILAKPFKEDDDETTYVDYLGIKRLLNKLVDDVERDVYSGSPETTLSQLVLKTEFQLTLEAGAGFNHILRIVPVITPPTFKLTPDNTHTLEITLVGLKEAGQRKIGEDLEQLCRRNIGATQTDAEEKVKTEYCRSPLARQLQALISAQSKAGQ